MTSYDDTATVSGSVVSIENGADEVGAKSCVVTVRPTLSGKSEVTETQTGRNLLLPHKADSAEITVNGIKRSYSLDNQEFTFNGTNTKTDASWLIFSINISDFVLNGLKSGVTYRFSHNLTADFYAQFTYNKSGGGVGAMGYLRGTAGRNASVSFTLPNDFDSLKQFQIGVSNTATDVDITAHFQIEVGSTAHAFEPYITPTTYTASLGRTIYGGTADIVNGVGTDGCAKDSMTSTYLSGLSSSYIGYEASTNYFGGHPTIWVRNWNYQTAKIRQVGGIGCVCNYFPVSMHNTDIINTQNRIYFDVNGKGISDVAGFIAFVQNLEANNESLDIVYELETKTDFAFNGQEVPTRLGYNAFWSEQGDTELTYYKSGYGFTSVTVNRTGKNLISVPIFTPSTPTLCFDAGRDITVSNITMSFLATNAVVHATNAAIVDYRKEDGTHTYRTLNWFRDANNNQFTANTPQNGKFKNSDSNITFRYIYIYYESISYSQFESDCISEWQIELASTASDYTPYEAVTKTAKLHKVIYGGTADVIRGTCEPKNLIYPKYEGRTNAGITYTVNSDHSITCQGVASATSWAATNLSGTPEKMQLFPAGKYTVSGGVSSNVRVYCGGIYTDGTTPYLPHDTGSGATITLEKPAYLYPQIRIESGTDLTTPVTIYIQLEAGSSVSDYVPHFEPFTFPPISIGTDEGENTLFANEGDSAITYRKAVD